MSDNKNGIYINGKEQALEILKLLTPAERDRILNNINMRNPTLANELKQSSRSFRDIEEYSTQHFQNIFGLVKPEILGLSLKETSVNFQKNILRSAPREYAENAFNALRMNIPANKRDTIQRAKNLVITQLSQYSQLN